jgi:cell division protein FtsB
MNKYFYILIISILVIIFGYILVFSETGYFERKKLKIQANKLKNDNLKNSENIELLKKQIEELKDENSFEIEKIAREKYGMLKQNERYIELEK